MPQPHEIVTKPRRSTRAPATKPRVRRARQDEVQQLVASYRATGSVAATAQQFGVTRQTVGQHLAQAGVTTASHMNEEQVAIVVQRYADGASATALSQELDFSPHSILKALRKRGVEIRR